MHKIRRKFVSHEAYMKIRDWIVSGEMAPGLKIRDKQLGERLGISRTPIREALLRLEEEGFIYTKPNCATLVSSVNFKDAHSLYSIVWTLESLAMAQAFGNITTKDIEKMKQANEKFLKSMGRGQRKVALEADNAFHSIFVALSKNCELIHLLADLKVKLMRLNLYYFEKEKSAQLSYDEHNRIIQALEEKDKDLAISLLEGNWKNSFARFDM
ncbi:GntR family transcriptional regulator [bacterium]|nr:GntR family transcriptional regulator [bacterium]